MRATRTLALSVLWLVPYLVAGCSGGGSKPARDGADGGAPAAADAGTFASGIVETRAVCSASALEVVRVRPWPGRGLQLAIRADRKVADDASLQLAGAGGSRHELVVQPLPEQAGLTVLVLVPAESEAEHARRVKAVRGVVQGLPEGERVALWVAGETLAQAAELASDPTHLLQRLGAVVPFAGSLDAAAFDRLDWALFGVDAAWGPVSRELVVVGAELPQARESAGVVTRALPPAALDEAAVNKLVAELASTRARLRRLGACGPFEAGQILTLTSGDASCTFEAPKSIAHLENEACAEGAAAADVYPLGDDIELVMSAGERATHDAYAMAKNEADFPLQVRLGTGEPIRAVAHFRGQSSLSCARKSYSVNLKNPDPRRLMPGVGDDEFYLISMCFDRFYYRQALLDRLMDKLGLFPLSRRYVRLKLGAEPAGLYLMLEKPEGGLLRQTLELASVLRRRLDANGKVAEVRLPEDPAAATRALTQYDALAKLIDSESPEKLYAALSARMDLDGYLRWMALQSAFQSGDYVDETFFYASAEAAAGKDVWYFRNHGWDPDDVFTACHHAGKFALPDPHGLMYCSEALLDRALLASDEVYQRFVAELEGLLEDSLTPELVAQELEQIRDAEFRLLDDDRFCASLGELVALHPEAAQCSEAKRLIQADMDAFMDRVRERQSALKTSIQTFRSTP